MQTRSRVVRVRDHSPAYPDTATTRQRYDRIAPFYNWMDAIPERFAFQTWRQLLWDRAEGPSILEIGVGTGKNIPYYPPGASLTAIDLSPRMLQRAMRQAEAVGADVNLQLADAQTLPFPDQTFDSVVSTFVFCSVPDPVQGLREAARVLKPGGQLLLLEHVLSHKRLLRSVMRLANPLMVRLTGANYDRNTVANVRCAGFELASLEDLSLDIVKLIGARRATRVL